MMLQLNPTIPVETPQGKGQAHLVIDYGSEHNLLWVCFLDKNGECWTFQNSQVRLQTNLTIRPQNITENITDPDFAEVNPSPARWRNPYGTTATFSPGFDPNLHTSYGDTGPWFPLEPPPKAGQESRSSDVVRWVVHDGCECTRCVLERAIAEGRVTFDDQPPESRRYRWTTTGSLLTSMREGYDPNKDPIYSGWGTWVRSVQAENLRYRWTCGTRIIMGAPENYDPNHDRVFNREGRWVRGPAHL